ncbi:MAG: SCO5389 family protein [Solirubrobacteraceae bacterium]
MSLDVQQDLLERAERGPVDERDFVECVRTSLPYAWDTIAGLADELATDGTLQFADNQVPPPDEQARGQLLRALASNAIRQALERHFGVTLAFQNCHRVAVFPADATSTSVYRQFSSPRAQLLNQSPLLRDC